VFRRDGDVWVEDLGSRNGTLLNGQSLVHAAQLRRGDQLQFGRTVVEATR
jgi:pSer/pThr/pTyr-binding forkhead associated (FHA) protein